MTAKPSSNDVSEWGRRIQDYEGQEAYQALLSELRADGPFAFALLDRLADHKDPVVRMWAGDAAKEIFGRDAVPLLMRMSKERNPDVRDSARQDLIEVDPQFLHAMLPSLRKVLKKRKDLWGEDRAAMVRVAKVRDQESVPLLRAYSKSYEGQHGGRHYGYRMPLVLADYIETPSVIAERIRAHDHDNMYWLVLTTCALPVPGGAEALEYALALPVDEECAEIIRNRPQGNS
jgi:hypothetical protein